MPASKAQKAVTYERRTQLIRLRIAGVPFEDPRILKDLDYKTRGAATKDFVRALEQRRDEEGAAVATYRQQENERLDALLHAAWPRATQPSPVYNKQGDIVGEELDMRAVDTVLRLMDRRAKLNGLDSPVRTELSGPDGGAVPLGNGSLAELTTLIGIAGENQEATTETEDAGGDSSS